MSTPRSTRIALTSLTAGLVLVAILLSGLAFRPGQPATSSMAQAIRPSPSPSPTVVTNAGDRSPDRRDFLRKRVFELLDRQAEALLRQDEAGFVGIARDEKARGDLLRRFRNLVSMRVTVFQYHPDSLEVDDASGLWRTNVIVSFCFVVPKCKPDNIREPMVWADTDAGPVLAAIEAASNKDSWYGRQQPWEVSDLHVAIGTRTLVATTAALKGRLPEVLREAEKAAVVADTFAFGGFKPDLYRIYLAAGNEWKTWYQYTPPKWAAGYAEPIGDSHTDVVINSTKIPSVYLDDILRHELTHVSTLQGKHHWKGNWWLIEGIADLADHPASLPASDWAAETRSYIRRGWDKRLPGEEPADNLSDGAVGARYGVAFLAVKSLETRFGREKLLDFFYRVVCAGASTTSSAKVVFGMDWAELEASIIADVRRFA